MTVRSPSDRADAVPSPARRPPEVNEPGEMMSRFLGFVLKPEEVVRLLGGRWAGSPVYVILGGGSEGMSLTGADAWLDNFVVETGTIPE